MKSMFDYTIIADFISPSLKDRVIYELATPKKRTKAWERFSHNIDSVINLDYIYFKGNSISNVIKTEIKNSTKNECLVLSFEYQEGKTMSIDKAFDYLFDEVSAVLIFNGNWLVIKSEYEGGEGSFYVLKKN